MNADDDTSTEPAGPTDPVDRGDLARSGPSKPGLAAATLAALRAGVRSAPSPVDGPGPEPASEVATEQAAEVATEPAPTNDTDADDHADAERAADDDADTDDTQGAVRSRPSVLTAVCAIVAVAALVFAAVAGALWWRADHGTARKIGVAREQIDTDARLAIVTVNTSDYRHPADALANWLDVSTGALHSQFSQSRSTVVRLLAQARMVTKATVLDAAVTGLNLTKGTARVIASVNVTRTPATGAVSTVRNRFRASMTRIGGEWKLSNLAPVPVSLS
jgi:Mce-associated membrane protein